jgi:serine/threonine protein kinase
MVESELPKPGDTVGVRYRIESVLGQGGMGAVFAAVNQATGRAVAIKWMLPGAARSQESVARFLAEARATAKIEHPNVIQILDVGQDGPCPFLVMERLRGSSLADRLEKHGRMIPEETLSVLIPACRGVAEAHAEGIIHRDLKPDNIFLCEGKDGSSRPPKVLDFGISKLYDQDGGPSLTRTGIAMGTPQYMSPEQLNAPPDADARFDVYAMGVVLYECLVGRPPYDAEGLFELVQQIAAGNPTPIRFLAPAVPPDLEAVVMRAMAVNREMRHPTMNELIRDLEQVWHRMQSGAPPPSVPITAPNGMPSGAGTPTPAYGGTGSQWGSQPSMHPPTSGSHYGHPPGTGPISPTGPAVVRPPSGGGGGAGLVIGLVAGVVFLLGVLVVGGLGAYYLMRADPETPTVAAPQVGGTTSGAGGDLVSPSSGMPTAPPVDSNPRTPQIGLTFTGACTPRFNARLMVTGGADNVNVMSTTAGGLTGSVLMSMPGAQGTVTISTRERTNSAHTINVMQGQRIWTNMATEIVAVTNGRIPDPISGTMTVTEFDPELARADVTFHGVTLQSIQDGTLCTIDGRLQTFGTTYGM